MDAVTRDHAQAAYPLPAVSPERLARILGELKKGLKQLLGNELLAIYLYGSHARGEARPGSDIDVLAVLREKFDYFEMLRKSSKLVADLSLENDVVISRIFVTQEDYNNGQTPLLINVRNEGIPI